MRDDEEKALRSVYEATIDYLKGLHRPSTKVLDFLPPKALEEKLGGLELPEVGSGLPSLMTWVDAYLQHAVKTGKETFWNQLFSGFSLPGYVGELVSALTNTSMYTYEVAPVATLMEKSLVRAMNLAIGFKDGEGIFTTGGTNANMTALFAALSNASSDWLKKGYRGEKENLVFFASAEAHYSFQKSASFLGLGREALVRTPTNDVGEMIPEALEEQIAAALGQGKKPFFVAATAGTTVLGAFDPIEDLARIASRHNLWLHVDGAWGGSVALSNRHKNLLRGVADADSFTWDPHKMMGLPLMCSTLLVRRKGTLKRINDTEGADYLFHDAEEEANKHYDLGRMSMQCGRRTDAVKLFFAWQCFGSQGFAKGIERLFDLAKRLEAVLLADDCFELLRPVRSLNLCFRVLMKEGASESDLNEHNLSLRRQLFHSGSAIVNYATIDGKVAFRLIVVNFATSFEGLVGLLDDLKRMSAERMK